MFYLCKNTSGTFVPAEQPAGFAVLSALENRFFLCESPSEPTSEFTVTAPDWLPAAMPFYQYPNGKKLWFDPFNGTVQFSEGVDTKSRRTVQYSQEQLDLRLSVFKWLMLNVWIPDKERLDLLDGRVPDNTLTLQASALLSDVDAEQFLKSNLYYDL